MTELQLGLLAIGAVVVAGVFAYNRMQERRAQREAQRSFASGHEDVLLGVGSGSADEVRAPAATHRPEPQRERWQPDERIDLGHHHLGRPGRRHRHHHGDHHSRHQGHDGHGVCHL